MRRSRLFPVLFAAALLAAAVAATTPAGAATVSASAEMRQRAAALFERVRQSRREGGESLSRLARDCVASAEEFERARLDTLAAKARLDAASLLARVQRDAEAEQQANLALAAALRARHVPFELRTRAFLVDRLVNRDPPLALRSIRPVVARARAIGDHEAAADASISEGHAFSEMGQWKEALAAFRRAATHAHRAGDVRLESTALTMGCQALRFLGRHVEGLAWADSAVAIARSEGISTQVARGLRERASVLRTLRRQAEGLAAIDESMAWDRRVGDTRSLETSHRYRTNLLLSMNRPREALVQLDTVQSLARERNAPTSVLSAAVLRGQALNMLHREAEADTMLEREIETFERWRAGIAGDESRSGLAEHLVGAYAVWARVRLARDRIVDAWQVCERGRASVLEQRIGARGVPDFGALAARLRRANAVLVEFDGTGSVTANAFLLDGTTVHAATVPASIRDAQFDAAIRALSTRGAAGSDTPALKAISDGLLGSVWQYVPPGTKRLIVVPPYGADALPFEALPVPGSTEASRIGDRLAVTYVPSAGVLMALDERTPEAAGLTVVADPAVDARGRAFASLEPAVRGSLLHSLPGARAEAKRLAQAGASVLLGRDATVQRVADSPPASVLHFATHALEPGRGLAEGGLVLAGEQPLLTPSRVEQMRIRADLVTLGGCRTMGSRSYRGEGAFGLARSFLVAGARSVITTRWEVGDRAAARFMEVFYDAARAGRSRDEALGQARETLRRERYPARDQWAFLLLGHPDSPLAPWAGGRAR